MAMMVARGSSPLASSVSVQEKGSRNKRKFRADPPPIDLNTLSPPMQTECPGYELFPTDNSNLECHTGVCDLCRIPAYGPREEELELEEFQDADWGDLTEAQLEDTVLTNLDAIFKSAIKMIASYGYTEEVAMNSVLRSGICYGCKDTVSNIAENALAFLRSGQLVDSSLRENFSEDLRKLEKSILADMVSVLREVRPFFSTGDAMWCLLICDMNVTHACAMDSDPLNVIGDDDSSSSSTVPQLEPQTNSKVSNSPIVPEFTASGLNKPNDVLHSPQSTLQPGTPTVLGIPNLPRGRFCASNNRHDTISNPNLGTEHPITSSDHLVDLSGSTNTQSSSPEEKRAGGRKGHIGISKRESILRQKSIHFEKSYRAFGSKIASRAGKHSSLGGLILDKKCKSISNSTVISMKSTSLKLSKAIGSNTAQVSATLNLSFSDEPNASSSYQMEAAGNPSPLPIANTDLSLSLPSSSSNGVSTKPNCSTPGIPSDKMCGHWAPQDKKDEMLLKLVPRVRELQVQLQEWTEWAQQKVMQAARRLGKDKVELHTLRQEKEEVARLKKEKRTLEENTKKKLSEMEIALSKAGSQVERANAAARRLEIENAKVRLEMEAAKLQAAQSATSCQEVSRREMKTLKKFQSWDREKALFQDELAAEKRKLFQLQQQLKQAKELQDQLQAKWKQEQTAKDEALTQANSLRKEREQIETAGKAKENAARLKAETDLQRHKTNIRMLEDQIAQLRLTTDSSKMAALRWGLDVSYASRLSEGRKVAKITDSQESVTEEIQRERECVMCLTEEMSVLFLPCAHQVVCTKCNELHEKQGMKDCPSCRTHIQRRICVLSADS